VKTIVQILGFLGKSVNIKNLENVQINHIYQDHRLCHSHDLFIALSGHTTGGHLYIEEAQQKPVAFIIVENMDKINTDILHRQIIEISDIRKKLPELANWFYDYPSNKATIFAVTGTNGKTSISHFIAQILTKMHNKTAVMGTLGNGIYPNTKPSSHTTLNVLELQSHLATYCNQSVKNIVMEASSHAIDQNRIAGTHINIAVFTHLSADHLDYHGNMENYFNVKSRLFEHPGLKCAVINQDDYYGLRLCKKLRGKQGLNLYCYSIEDENADCFIAIKNIETNTIEVTIFWQKTYIGEVRLPIIGVFNVSNIAAAITACIAEGYAVQKIVPILSKLSPVPGRMETISISGKPVVIIDYAHNADSLEKLLKSIQASAKNKIICVFGCGGNRDTEKRPVMARVTEKYADFCIVTEDNNRNEPFSEIAKAIVAGFSKSYRNFTVIANRKQAIKQALDYANMGDIVVLAGKGHERYLDHQGYREYFNEREIVEKYWHSLSLSK